MFGNEMADMTKENKKNNISKVPTKERILNAAFELSANSSIKAVSLNEIAQKAGIAKPGIFRYYKSKDDLQEVMKNRFFDDFCAFFATVPPQDDNSREAFEAREKMILDWFINRYEYLCFFLGTLVESEGFIPSFLYEVKKRNLMNGVETSVSFNSLCKKTLSKKMYVRTTELFFLLARVYKVYENSTSSNNTDIFCNGLIRLLYEGWEDLAEISNERSIELDSLCKEELKHFPQENRMFQALSSLLEKYVLPEITVEKMAGELGMAKSSLYSHYRNKEDMIKGLIEEELLHMLKIIYRIAQKGETFSECIYLHMRGQIEYFINRPSIVPVCNRLSVQGFLPEKFLKDFFDNLDDKYKGAMNSLYPFPQLGFDVDGFIVGGWVFSMAAAALKQGQVFNIEKEEIIKVVKDFHFYMKNGIKSLDS